MPHHDAVYDRVGNILMTRLMGADSRLVDDGFDIGIRESWEDAIQSVKDAGGKPYRDSRPALRCTNTAASAMSASPKRSSNRRRRWASPSTTSSSAW